MSQVHVPKLGERTRIPDEAIEEVVQEIVERFDPDRVVLFGSYAEGHPRPDSDVDMLVVMNTPLKETEQAVLICQSIEYHFGLDLLVRTPATIQRRLALGDPFLQEIMQGGRVLYERAEP